jgi:hypothetical protein
MVTKATQRRRLPFERAYLIESTPCVKCGGTGHSARSRDTQYGSATCWTCKGLGWKATEAGRDLFYDICALVGISVTRWPTRINPFLVRGRRFTAAELQAIDTLMAARVGRGAIAASS